MKTVVALLCAQSCVAATSAFLGGTIEKDAKGRATVVNLRSSWIEDSDLLELARLTTVSDLDLSETRITDIGFQALKTLPGVTRVNLYYTEQIGDGALAAMKGWKQLRSLNLRGTKVTDAGLVQLAGLPIETIDVGYSLFTDNGFDALVNLQQLKRLAVGGNKITDTGLNSVRLLPNLIELDMSGSQRTDSGMWAATITDRSIETIDSLQTIEILNLRGAKFTDPGFAKLSRLKSLKRIDLGETTLSEFGLAPLAKFPLLEHISLYNARKVTDGIVPVLAGLTNLRWVDLTGTGVTQKGLDAFKAAHPNCTVMWEAPAN